MEYVTIINSINDIQILNNSDAFLLGNHRYAIHIMGSFSLNDIKKTKKTIHSLGKKIYILVNKIFFDDELESLYFYLKKLKEINVDGIYFADFAVYEIAKELNMLDKLVFYHETFARSYFDIKRFINLKIKQVIISKDSSLESINKLNNKEKLGITFMGYMPLYYSKRKVLSNQQKVYKLNIDTKQIYQLKEEKREELNYLIENKNGSIIFYAIPLNYYHYKNELEKYVSTFVIQTLFFDLNKINNFINLCKNKTNKTYEDIFENQQFTDGFLIKKVGLK